MRGLAVVGLAGISLVHLAQAPDTWHETKDLAALFIGLAIACAVVAVMLIFRAGRFAWTVAALTAVGPILGYVVTRSMSVFFDHGDVGNWLEPLALVALFIEASVLLLSLWALQAVAGRHDATASVHERQVRPR